jgi:hypothetical protein
VSEIPSTYEIKDGMVFIRAPRLLVVLPVSVWVAGIKRGKGWRRHGGERPGRVRERTPRGEIVERGGK